MFTPLGCKDIGVRNCEFVAKTQLLSEKKNIPKPCKFSQLPLRSSSLGKKITKIRTFSFLLNDKQYSFSYISFHFYNSKNDFQNSL